MSSLGRHLLSELVDLVLQVHHHRDAGEVEPGREQLVDPAQPGQVVLAVPPRASGGAVRGKEPVRLVPAQLLQAAGIRVWGESQAAELARLLKEEEG